MTRVGRTAGKTTIVAGIGGNGKQRIGALLLGSTVLCSAVLLSGAAALAQQTTATQTSVQSHRFAIPAQSLPSAIDNFSRVTGWQVGYSSQLGRSITTKAVAGVMAPADALRMMFAGTGVQIRLTGRRSAALVEATAAGVPGNIGANGGVLLDTINVEGAVATSTFTPPAPYAGGQVATGGQVGLLGNRSLMDTPFNQTNFTAKRISDQQARTVRDVLTDDPSVRQVFHDNGPGADRLAVRGFAVVPNSMAYGGLYGVLPQNSVMAELAERVELLKGPSAMLYGMPPNGSIGGTVNLVPKHATDTPITQLTTDYSSKSRVGGHVDLGRRYGERNEFGVRFNGVYRDGNTATDGSDDQRALGVLGLDYRSDRVRVSADVGYQYQKVTGLIPYFGVTGGTPIPSAPDASQRYGQPWSYKQAKDTFAVLRGEVDITDNVTAYAAIGGHDSSLDGLFATNFTVNNVNGNATSTPQALSSWDRAVSGEAGIRSKFDTGPVGHEVAVSVAKLENQNGSVFNIGTGIATNLYNPVIVAQPNLTAGVAPKTAVYGLTSVAVADTLSAFDKRVMLTVGARWQSVSASNFDATTGARTSAYEAEALSPSVGLVVKPLQNVSLYANYIQGLQQGTVVASSFANAGQVFPPYKTVQYEAGVKVDWGRITTTVSAFQIAQPSTITDVASNTQLLNGEQRNRGIELNVFGEVYDGIRVIGGAMFLNPILTKTQSGLTDGFVAAFSPRTQVNLGGEWDPWFMSGLTLASRVVYTSSQYIDTTLPRRELPAWTRLDAGIRYALNAQQSPTGKPITVRLNVENVLGNDYWATGFGATTLSLGAPRTYMLSTTFDF